MSEPTTDELISTIQHSHLPTVVVEGKTDVSIYRKLEEILGTTNANFLPCGGRIALLTIYRKRATLAGKLVCFVADMDMWIFAGVHPDYHEIIFSNGYSIENDLYCDSNLEKILREDERPNHSVMIQETARWFSCEVEKYRRKNVVWRSEPPSLEALIPRPNFTCCPEELKNLDFVEPDAVTRADVANNYKIKLRGKLLYEVLLRFSDDPNRDPRYDLKKLRDKSVADSINKPLLTRIFRLICEKLRIKPDGAQLSLPGM